MKRRKEPRDAPTVFPFYWDVPRGGWAWVDVPRTQRPRNSARRSRNRRLESERFLVWNLDPGRRYEPLREEPGLFLTLAGLETTQDAIAQFAARYGPLGVPRVFTRPSDTTLGGEQFDQFCYGEPLATWLHEVAGLKGAVSIWRRVQAGKPISDTAQLGSIRELLALSSKNTTTGPWPDVAGDSIAAPHAKALASSSREPAKSLSREVAQHVGWFSLSQTVSAKLNMHAQVCLVYAKGMARPQVHVIPKTLLGAAWLQLALAISGDKDYRACESCGAWFATVPGEGYTLARRFCSTRCRMRASRRTHRRKGDAQR